MNNNYISNRSHLVHSLTPTTELKKMQNRKELNFQGTKTSEHAKFRASPSLRGRDLALTRVNYHYRWVACRIQEA